SLPITLSLRLSSGGPDNEYTDMNTDASGFFTASVTGLPSGLYNWRVKDPKYLANAGTLNLTGATTNTAEMGLMRVGDCDNNDAVNIVDFNILSSSFARAFGDPGYDDRADLDGNQVINATDFGFL